MGRMKLKIKRLENSSGRHVTYSKRRAGITKKAKELSILCGIDIVLLMFSPTGKPTLCLGEHSNIKEVIAKFAQLTPQERAKRKLESLEALKRTFKKLDHDVNIQDFLGSSSQTVEDLSNLSQSLKAQISEIERQLSYWTDPENINNVEQIRKMEETLTGSLNQIRMQQEYLRKQIMSLDCADQFHNGMHLPMAITNEQQSCHMQWLHDSDNQNLILLEDSSLLPQRNLQCSTDVSLQDFPGFFSIDTQQGCSKYGTEEPMNSLSHNSCSLLKLRSQYPYNSFDLSLLGEKKLMPDGKANFQEVHVDSQVSGFEPFWPDPPVFDSRTQIWPSTPGSCGVSMFDDHPYPQQPNQI